MKKRLPTEKNGERFLCYNCVFTLAGGKDRTWERGKGVWSTVEPRLSELVGTRGNIVRILESPDNREYEYRRGTKTG